VIFHAYVLIQVILLARTAAAYNEAIKTVAERDSLSFEENSLLRQRLANTLFAQIFAGSPRERGGWLGSLLKVMAWITLGIAPILILLVFQFMFLPYHSHLATWMHRLLILVELAVLFWLWPSVVDSRRDIEWSRAIRRIKQTTAFPFRLMTARGPDRRKWRRFRFDALALIATLLFVMISLLGVTFPGEPHANFATGHAWSSVHCERWLAHKIDRLDLPRIDVVDDENLVKIVQRTSDRKLEAHEGERTRNFRERDLSCSDLSSADLRRVDLTSANLFGARLVATALDGASLNDANLQHADLDNARLGYASLDGANLQNASIDDAQLQGASLLFARLQRASLVRAWLQGATLVGAELQGASLNQAQLQGASLDAAQLQGASLDASDLQGASLNRAQLQGASLYAAGLQGASVTDAQLQGASFEYAQLQGTDFNKSSMTFANLSGAYVWRARGASCGDAYVIGHKPDAIIEVSRISGRNNEEVHATPDEIAKFIERSVEQIRERDGYMTIDFSGAYISYMHSKSWTSEKMRSRLIVDLAKDDTHDIAKVWSDCEDTAKAKAQGELSQFLRDFACNARDNRNAIVSGIARNWIPEHPGRPAFSALLAVGLLGEDGRDCAATKDLDEPTKKRLWKIVVDALNAVTPKEALPTPPTSAQ
jgi:uncharacterized protein YjbI with pentapeptide repeats